MNDNIILKKKRKKNENGFLLVSGFDNVSGKCYQ